jgi:SOS-response transcriptional repressor LexA
MAPAIGEAKDVLRVEDDGMVPAIYEGDQVGVVPGAAYEAGDWVAVRTTRGVAVRVVCEALGGAVGLVALKRCDDGVAAILPGAAVADVIGVVTDVVYGVCASCSAGLG